MARNRTKYHSKKVVLNGITFQSKKEAKRWQELSFKQDLGVIADLQRQVKFVLIPAQRESDQTGPRGGKIKGKLLEREASYYADFVYHDLLTNEIVVEDTKGMRTKDYILKRKLMLYIHKIRIREI